MSAASELAREAQFCGCASATWLYYLSSPARYPSGKGEVCKTFIRGFDSHPRLQSFLFILSCLRNGEFALYLFCTSNWRFERFWRIQMRM
jgi:hypothetical protein